MTDTRVMPAWKIVACVRCGAQPGQICMKLRLGTVNHWIRTNPHAIRRKFGTLAAAIGNKLEKSDE